PRRKRHDSPDLSPPRRKRHDSPDDSPKKKGCKSAENSARRRHQATPDLSPPRRRRPDSDPDASPPRRTRPGSPSVQKQSRAKGPSPATKKLRQVQRSPSRSPDSDLSPPRRAQRASSPPQLSPQRRSDARGSPKKVAIMSSGGKAGLVSADVLRREQQELRKQQRNKVLEDESQHSQTVFRDKWGRKRNLEQERLEQQQQAEAQAERDEQYARWGRGLAQGKQQQQNVEDALKEMQKPLARYIDDQDLDRMLREQEREGDPMADFIKKRKAKESKEKKEKPRYKGPAPPLNRFNIWPGHRWDGVDRSNGFEQQRFARMANKKAVQELAYKWSVEDM
ncbi:BUD13, partial [Colius striatus]